MKLIKRVLIGISFICLMFQAPAIAFGRKKPPVINPKEKIEYINIHWWSNFSDPLLKYYIIKAIVNNHDVKQASWKVEEYKQSVKLQFSQELPSLSVGTSYVGSHLPNSIKNPESNIFAVPLLANYEADIFLKNHDKTKSSKKAYQSSRFQEQSIYISLASDVATTYINIVKFDKQIKLQKAIVVVRTEELSRARKQYKNGTISVPKLNIYKKENNIAKNELEELLKNRDNALNQLAVLLGDSPNNISELKRGDWDNLEYDAQIPTNISSDVVFSRPDILAAESNLEKSKIDVTVARKEFLPRINLSGIYAFSNIGSIGFGSWGSSVAAIIASATMDLFRGGLKVANLKRNKARYEQMFQAYRQTDLNALKEVNDSMLIIKQNTKIDENIDINLKIQKNNYKRTLNSYKYGVVSYLNLLSEREQLLNVKQNKVDTKATRLVDYITLYKAVGGKL